MQLIPIKNAKMLARSVDEALDGRKDDCKYRFGLQLVIPSMGEIELTQLQTIVRKTIEALSAFNEEFPCQFTVEVGEDSKVDHEITDQTRKNYEAKLALHSEKGIVVPEKA